MNIFDTIKQNVTARQAAELYGIEVNRHKMCCCPFHADKRPSAIVDERFHCFGCGEDLSVIDFTAKLFAITPIEACKRLARDFGISVPDSWNAAPTVDELYRVRIKSKQKQFDELTRRLFAVLRDYYLKLMDYRKKYAPKTPDEQFDERFTEALRNMDFVDWALDVLNTGTASDKADLIAEYGRRIITDLENKI